MRNRYLENLNSIIKIKIEGKNINNFITRIIKKKIEIIKLRYEKSMSSKVFTDPYSFVNEKSMELDKYIKSLDVEIKNKYNESKSKFMQQLVKLDTLSPLKTLSRGYSITEKDGKIIKSKNDLNKNDEIEIKFFDGIKHAKVL